MCEPGGTGKLRSYWVEAVFKVLKKREGLPVYEIKNVRKSSDVRVVHRNMMMRCNELPLSVLDEEHAEKVLKAKKNQKKASDKEKELAMPALEQIRVTTPALEPVVVGESDLENNGIAVVVHTEPEVVPVVVKDVDSDPNVAEHTEFQWSTLTSAKETTENQAESSERRIRAIFHRSRA